MGFRFALAATLGAALLALASVGILSYQAIIRQDEEQRWVAHTHFVLESLNAMLSDLSDEETNQRAFIITGEVSYLQPYESSIQRLQREAHELRTLTNDNPTQQGSLDRIDPLLANRFAELQRGVAVRNKQGLTAAVTAVREGNGKKTAGQFRALIGEMQDEERRLLRQRREAADANSRRTKTLIVAGNGIALLFLFIAAVVIFREMGRRHKAEEALREGEERFRLQVSAVKDYAILMLDPKGRIATWNTGAERINGYRAEEILGKHFSIFYPPEDVEHGKPGIELNTATEQGGVEDEGWRVRKDGSRFWANVVITALRDEKGRLRGFGKVSRDLTERRRAEQDMETRNVQLEAANRELQAFSYSVSHDLRAPLRAIDGFSLALLEDYENKLDADGNEHLQRIRAAAGRMGRLIDGMLNLARISRTGMVRESIDLSPLAQEIVSELQNTQPARRATIVIPPKLQVKGDRLLLRVVLENLLSNAWKFTSEQPNPRIELGIQSNGNETVHFLRDNGAGFDMRHADKLFGVFQRLHRESEFPGTGVGLATVQRIIHRHGGRIWAEAVPGEGATFYFVLGDSQLHESPLDWRGYGNESHSADRGQ
jgi:PAS domain S-box-containing protein